jgi:hypothetical protein
VSEVLRLRAANLTWREIDGELVALEAESSRYLTANPAGTLLWRLLSGGATREQLVEALCATYGIDRERSEADVDAYLADVRAQGLLAA